MNKGIADDRQDRQVRKDLQDLLNFATDLLAGPERGRLDITSYPVHLTGRDLCDDHGAPLPGIAFASAEDTWISLTRLGERPPPAPPPALAPWLRSDARPDPAKPPVLAPLPAGEGGRSEIADAFAGYVNGLWRAWAAEEVPRRRTIGLYELLYKAHLQIAGAGAMELVVGIGLAVWRSQAGRRYLPLIEQRAEFEIDPVNGTLAIVPRTVPPTLEPGAFRQSGIDADAVRWREAVSLLEAAAKDPDLPFGPFQPASFRQVLEACAAALGGAVIGPEDEAEDAPEEGALRIIAAFCLLVRPRRDDIRRDDIARLADRLCRAEIPVPETARRFVVEPPDVALDEIGFVDLERAGNAGAAPGCPPGRDAGDRKPPERREWLFFPLPANPEQMEIARRLERPDVHGVVVQGPPGTGKSHTIANIISHSMAMGRRVLVSAHTAEALSVISGMLPEAQRVLTVAVTGSDREAARQLEQAVAALAERALRMNVADTMQRAEDLLRLIVRHDGRLAEIDAELWAIGVANLSAVEWGGGFVLPQAIAAWSAAQGQRHAWFPDRLDLVPEHEPRFGEAEIARARSLRRRLGEDLRLQPGDPAAGFFALPPLGGVLAAHRLLRDAAARQRQEQDGTLPRPDLTVCTAGEAEATLAWLERLAAWRQAGGRNLWVLAAWQALAQGGTADLPDPEPLRSLLEEAADLVGRGEALALEALELAETAFPDQLAVALARLAEGREPFGPFGSFGQMAVKRAVTTARVAAMPPRAPADWARLAALHAWRCELPGFLARWNVFAARHGLARLPADPVAAHDTLAGLGHAAGGMLALAPEAKQQTERLRAIFPYGLDAEAAVLRAEVAVAVAALRANLGEARLAEAGQVRTGLQEAGERIGGGFGAATQLLAGLLGTAAEEALVAGHWREVQAAAARLAAAQDSLTELAAIADLLRQSGASLWADRLLREPPGPDDPLLPPDWRDAWEWSRATGFLAGVADRGRLQLLGAEHATLVARQEQVFREVIGHLTHLGLRRHLTGAVQTALKKILAALARLPKTPGGGMAVRHRRLMRESLHHVASAIPCWIVPEWRVAEQLPVDPGFFDLVVIDEASQSNLLALATVLRGRKLLVVGDHQQVSPDAVDIDPATVTRLRRTYLSGQKLAQQMDPTTSLYELASLIYPGQHLMLREHFRCVEPIIRFSSRHYNGRLVPLRLPRTSERLDPPLLDILVEDGCRRGEVNEAEAAVIVAEIQALVADPALHAAGRRSIGVISLHTDRQARLIFDRLLGALGPAVIEAHRIKCGDAAAFQGQERDVVFLSMVHDAATAAKQSSQLYEQRYNVALSRARDRLVLVRSVTAAALTEGDVKLAVLRHFCPPPAGRRIGPPGGVLAACETELEQAVGARLLAAGYRLRAQVPVGGHHIDFVVEGAGDRRLAVELDGATLQGPERWAQDIRWQRTLERVGWTFWRCWASEWETATDEVFADLVRTLERHGIIPLGAAVGDGMPAAFRVVRAGVPAGAADDDQTVRVGDKVVVRFADGPARCLTVRVAADGTANGHRRFAAVLLGLRQQDEAEMVIDGQQRVVVVEAIHPAI